MADATLSCPHCKREIKLTESLAAPLIEKAREQFTKAAQEREAKVAEREAALVAEKTRLQQQRALLEEEIADRVKRERKTIVAEEAKKARESLSHDLATKDEELASLKTLLETRTTKLAEAQKAQATLIEKQRELDEAKREVALSVQKGISTGLAAEREKARKETEERLKLTLAERDEKIAAMTRQIDELRHKAEQGSEQLHGEVQEIDLETTLKLKFEDDDFVAVAKGQRGGDIVQHVRGSQGTSLGKILWEAKRTKRFSHPWLAKLKEDQRVEKAEVAILVTHALPDDVESFDMIDGVWVTHPRFALPVALALRQSLLDLAKARLATEGHQTKQELVYEYLTSLQFRQRIEAIVEAYRDMREDLDKERRALMNHWSKREKQLDRMLGATTGMFGDLQGIVGRSLKEIDGLSVKRLAAAGSTVGLSSP